MISLKPGVRVRGIRPELTIAVTVAGAICRRLDVDLVITSCSDGKHSLTSLHYAGAAFDMRCRDMSREQRRAFLEQSRAALGTDFDVLDEDDHFHIEYQPEGE